MLSLLYISLVQNGTSHKRTQNVIWLDTRTVIRKTDISRQTIISIENGHYNPSSELAYHIAKLFQLKIEDVFIFEKGSD